MQHSVFTYRIDIYFRDHKLDVVIDEIGHKNRDNNYEIQRQKAIEKELNCKSIRINLDRKNLMGFAEISKIQNHIVESNKKLTKKTVINDISIELLKLKPKEEDSIKRKFLRYIVKKILPKL